MENRRTVIISLAMTAGLAGCGGSSNSEPDSQPSNTSDAQDSSSEGEPEQTSPSLKNVQIDIDNVVSGFGGIRSDLRIVNEKQQEENRKRVQVKATAYSDGEVIGEDSSYITFTYEEGVELLIEEVSNMGEYSLSDVTRFTISGRITDSSENLTVVHDFNNEELQTKIEETGDTQ